MDQYEKFIEKRIIEKSLTAGLNTVTFESIILEKGDFVGLKTRENFLLILRQKKASLFISNGYLGTLQEQRKITSNKSFILKSLYLVPLQQKLK